MCSTSGMKFTAALLSVAFCLHLGLSAVLPGPKCGFPEVRGLLDRSLRIVGGTEALYGSHPWLVSLKSMGLHFCGGSILSDRWILTAAHCLYHMSNSTLQNVTAVVGEHDRRRPDRGEQTFRLKTVKIHEKYRSSSPMNYDIALLELDGQIQFGEHAQPLCLPLPSEKFQPSASCIVAGWGRVRERGYLPPVTQEVMLDLVDPARCKHVLQTLRPRRTPLTVVCAGPERGGRDACQGDSGGPLLCRREDDHWAVVGVTSWGKGCGRSWIDNLFKSPRMRGSPGIFTDVKVFLPWIKNILKEAELQAVVPPRLCHVTDGTLTGHRGLILNPAVPAQTYANNEMCLWSINATEGHHILLEFLKFDLENDTLCHSDQLGVLGGDDDRVIGRYCGDRLPGPLLISSSRANVQFVSDASGPGAGFAIQYKAVPPDFQLGPNCGTVALFQTQGAAVRSPRHPEAYGGGADCRWVIHAPQGHIIKLEFHDFDLEHSERCQFDSLKIFGDIDERQDIVVLCGSHLPPPVLSYDSVMVIRFSSDNSVTARGFHATPTFISRSELHEGGTTRLEDESEPSDIPHLRNGQTAGCGMSQYPAGSEEGGLDAGGEGEGEGTSLEAWPWNVRLHLGTEVMCLGAILQTGWIITAAHCVHELDEEVLDMLTVETSAPDNQVNTNTTETQAEHMWFSLECTIHSKLMQHSRRVRTVLLHPDYGSSSQDSDVALLQLDSELVLSEDIQPICLPSPLQEASLWALDCSMSAGSRHGGAVALNSNASQHSVETLLMKPVECEHYYPGRLADSMLCAEPTGQNQDSSCMDHDGDALVCRRPHESSFFILGVSSWTEGCGTSPRPVVYSSILHALDWILEQLHVTLDENLQVASEEMDYWTESSGEF
ncbi:ovochymase-2 [Engraulis encrasicolus]|uniref:ovochymase-2 n=1 Tax=Engraulis encrasicolus TaxID=184585 RepID=UPI002FD08D72